MVVPKWLEARRESRLQQQTMAEGPLSDTPEGDNHLPIENGEPQNLSNSQKCRNEIASGMKH